MSRASPALNVGYLDEGPHVMALSRVIIIITITMIILGCFKKKLRYDLHTVECTFVKCVLLSLAVM